MNKKKLVLGQMNLSNGTSQGSRIGAQRFVKYFTLEEARKNYDAKSEKNWRHRCFFEKGFDCVQCDIKGLYFAEWIDKGNGKHLDLFGMDSKGVFMLMTVDHIVPLSKGGAKKDVKNLQTMCRTCNTAKGSTYEASIDKTSEIPQESETVKHLNEYDFRPPWERTSLD